jgi:hypothetical protein
MGRVGKKNPQARVLPVGVRLHRGRGHLLRGVPRALQARVRRAGRNIWTKTRDWRDDKAVAMRCQIALRFLPMRCLLVSLSARIAGRNSGKHRVYVVLSYVLRRYDG